MTKKIFCIVLALMMLATVSLTGCKDANEDKPESSAVESCDSSEEASISDSSEETSEFSSEDTTSEETSESSSEDTKDFSNEEAKAYLQKVLEKEENFTYKYLVWETVTTANLEKFNFNTVATALHSFLPDMYAYVDLDLDGIDELLITNLAGWQCLVLRYDGEKATGYTIEHLSSVKTDGTISIGEILDDNKAGSISKISFDGLDYEITDLAYRDASENLYQLDQKPASKDEVENYFDNWTESTTGVSWTKIDREIYYDNWTESTTDVSFTKIEHE